MEKSLDNRKKALLLHPQRRKTLLDIPAALSDFQERNFRKKKIKKSLREKKKLFIFAPRKTRKLLERLAEKRKDEAKKKASKIFQVFLAREKKKF